MPVPTPTIVTLGYTMVDNYIVLGVFNRNRSQG